MIDWSWIATPLDAAVMVLLTAAGIYVTLILFTRLAGLRSFSKISSFDFAITVGMGTVLAGTLLNREPPLVQGMIALGALYGLQAAASALRRRFERVATLLDNEPILLMAGPEVLHGNLDRAGLTPADLRAKLREANVLRPDQIRAVVMESTGDVSVLHGDPDGPALDPELLTGVRDADRL